MLRVHAVDTAREMGSIAHLRQASGATLDARPAGDIRVRDYEPADKAAVLEVLRAAFGSWPQGIKGVDPEEFFRWKLERCPFGGQVSLLAEADGAVIGFVAQLPWPLRLGERTLMSLRGMDLAVHPAHRGRGVSRMIMRAAIEGTPGDVAIAWNNPNEQSRPGLLKTGRREVVALPRFAAPALAPARRLARALGEGSRTPADLPVGAPSAGELLRGGAYVSGVLDAMEEPDGRLVTARSLDYLRWRYGHFPSYRAVRADAGRDAAGIAIFRQRRHGRLWVSEVCELLVAGNDPRSARHLLAKIRRAGASDLLGGSFASRRQAARCGFLRVGGGSLLTIRRLGPDLPDLTRGRSWGLSFGDLELL